MALLIARVRVALYSSSSVYGLCLVSMHARQTTWVVCLASARAVVVCWNLLHCSTCDHLCLSALYMMAFTGTSSYCTEENMQNTHCYDNIDTNIVTTNAPLTASFTTKVGRSTAVYPGGSATTKKTTCLHVCRRCATICVYL